MTIEIYINSNFFQIKVPHFNKKLVFSHVQGLLSHIKKQNHATRLKFFYDSCAKSSGFFLDKRRFSFSAELIIMAPMMNGGRT